MGAKNLIRTTATVDGVPLGEFRTFDGGAFDMTERKNASGAGQKRRAKTGKLTTDNVTVGREDDGAVDLTWLREQRGKDMVVTRQPLDDDGNPRGKPTVYTGKLKRCTPGAGDVNDETDDDVFELEQLTDDL